MKQEVRILNPGSYSYRNAHPGRQQEMAQVVGPMLLLWEPQIALPVVMCGGGLGFDLNPGSFT